VNSHVLRPFLFRPPDHFTEPGFRLLQLPLARSRPSALRPASYWRMLSKTSHADQISTCDSAPSGWNPKAAAPLV
jgi:hypothetical protein